MDNGHTHSEVIGVYRDKAVAQARMNREYLKELDDRQRCPLEVWGDGLTRGFDEVSGGEDGHSAWEITEFVIDSRRHS